MAHPVPIMMPDTPMHVDSQVRRRSLWILGLCSLETRLTRLVCSDYLLGTFKLLTTGTCRQHCLLHLPRRHTNASKPWVRVVAVAYTLSLVSLVLHQNHHRRHLLSGKEGEVPGLRQAGASLVQPRIFAWGPPATRAHSMCPCGKHARRL